MEMAFGSEEFVEAPCEYTGVCIDEVAEGAYGMEDAFATMCNPGSQTGVTVTPFCPDQPSTLRLSY